MLSPNGLIPWFSKTEGNTYATLMHHPFLFKGKPTHAQEVALIHQTLFKVLMALKLYFGVMTMWLVELISVAKVYLRLLVLSARDGDV